MVVVVDAGLNTLSIREYPNAEVFYSVYADGNYFYVCGKTPAGSGIVLRDFIFPAAIPPTAYVTPLPWEYHKIKVNNFGRDLVVSGTNYSRVGFTAFSIAGGAFTPIVITTPIGPFFASWSFTLPLSFPKQLYSNSKVIVTDYPNNPTGFTLSFVQAERYGGVWYDADVLTYVFSSYTAPPICHELWAFTTIFEPTFLSDANTAPVGSQSYPNGGIAWVVNVNFNNRDDRFGLYIAMDLPLMPLPQSVSYIRSHPPLSLMGTEHTQLHKVHYHNGHFHCGGFYNHHDTITNTHNKTTLVMSPQQLANSTVCYVEQNQQNTWLVPQPTRTPFTPIMITVSVNFNPWIDVRYIFCDTDCDNSPLVPSNCGNR